MRNYLLLILISTLFISGNSCRKSYHQQDLKVFAGNWKIVKVEVDGVTIENYGEITIGEDGIGKLRLNHYPYDPTTPAVEGIFNLATNAGIDYYVRLYGAYWLNSDGTPGHSMCDRESVVSVRIYKPKKKSMQWEFAETTSIYDCDLRQNANGIMVNVKWYLERE